LRGFLDPLDILCQKTLIHADSSNSPAVFDLTDPARPVVVPSWMLKKVYGMTGRDGLLYVAGRDSRFFLIPKPARISCRSIVDCKRLVFDERPPTKPGGFSFTTGAPIEKNITGRETGALQGGHLNYLSGEVRSNTHAPCVVILNIAGNRKLTWFAF
jgi:hypothetical protein